MRTNTSSSHDQTMPADHFSQRRIVVLVSSLAAMLFAMLAVWGIWTLIPSLPITQVTFSGSITHTRAENLRQLALGVRGSVWGINLLQVRAAAKALPWVREATVQRRFPNALHIRIEEHQAFARWQGSAPTSASALVNTYGEVFKGSGVADADLAAMPLLVGPEGRSQEVMKQYAEFTRQLSAVEHRPVQVVLSARNAWQITLENGSRLELGHDDVEKRLARFVGAWPHIAALREPVSRIDLRYPNGVAIQAASPQRNAETRNG